MQKRQLTFEAIGTNWVIAIRGDISDSQWSDLESSVHHHIDEFDKTYSRFRPDSLVTTMASRAATFDMPADAARLLNFYEQLYRATDGAVTPLIGQVVSDAGYDATYSLQPKPLRQPPSWENVIAYDQDSITLRQPALLDFGAAGKGYLVDIVAGLLDTASLTDYVINAGGDIKHRTSRNDPLRVGLENPADTTEVIGVASITNQSICASSGSRRQWAQYHHIINPNTLESPRDVVATWAVADTTMTADGLATALFFTEPVVLQRQFSFSYAILRNDMSLEYSPDFPAKIHQDAA